MSKGTLTAAKLAEGARVLSASDPLLGEWITRIGSIKLNKPSGAYSVLAQSIIAQQLSDKAAGTIAGRVIQLLGDLQDPGNMCRQCDTEEGREALRACGVSRPKIGYLAGLADAFGSGVLSDAVLARMADAEVIEHLVQLKGLGRWSAEMFLIFGLRRPDVFSPGDLALRRGIMRLCDTQEMTPTQCDEYAKRWTPWRTVASLYLWRIAHVAPNLS